LSDRADDHKPFEYNFPSNQPPRRTQGIYGDHPRLPSRRPARYIFAYEFNEDRLAHLAPFRTAQLPVVSKHQRVDIATMGLERFVAEPNISQHSGLPAEDNNEYMDEDEEAAFFERMNEELESGFDHTEFNPATQNIEFSPPILPSPEPSQLASRRTGLQDALSNFRARFGDLPNGGDSLGPAVSDVLSLAGDEYMGGLRGEVYPAWMAL
jgi:hypothetical protein